MIDKIFRAIGLPLILAGLSACANPSYVAPSHTIKIFQMERPVYFLSSEVPACGDPIAQEDVLVVNVDLDEDIGKAVQRQAGIGAEYSDRWFRYRSGGVHPNTLIVNAQKAFAERGCNLVVLTKKPISRYNLVSPEEYIGLRWGMR